MNPALLARETVETYIKERKIPKAPRSLQNVEIKKAGAFVSIKALNKDLRGCIGTIMATKNTLIEEIMQNAISAATTDPRFSPIQRSELTNLVYSVDVLHPFVLIDSILELDPQKYGIIAVSKVSGKQALLLPMLEGVDTVDEQIDICRKKAGMPASDDLTIYKFKVNRYSE